MAKDRQIHLDPMEWRDAMKDLTGKKKPPAPAKKKTAPAKKKKPPAKKR